MALGFIDFLLKDVMINEDDAATLAALQAKAAMLNSQKIQRTKAIDMQLRQIMQQIAQLSNRLQNQPQQGNVDSNNQNPAQQNQQPQGGNAAQAAGQQGINPGQ